MDVFTLIALLRDIVGPRHVVLRPNAVQRYCTGYRSGSGVAEAVVRPGSLIEQWRVVRACLAAGRIIIMQAANTGLTGGSTPYGTDYDRPVIIINTLRIRGIHVINRGQQVVCLPGATLHDLERVLKPLGRDPHSVIGSSCIGASVFGGICNNSGGALVQRGPAYTELALFAMLDEQGELRLVNHLGIELGEDPEEILQRLEQRDYREADIDLSPSRRASDQDYLSHVREIEAHTPARFNADPRRLFEASGSAGRLILFAVRLDTFSREEKTSVFYIGTNSPIELTKLRRDILSRFRTLPAIAEYMHRTAFNMAKVYGKDTVLAIRYLGTSRLPKLFALKARIDAAANRCGILHLSDRLLQRFSRVLPNPLPRGLRHYGDRYEHHLILKIAGDGIEEARSYLSSAFPSANGDYFECTAEESERALGHRFAAASAAVRFRAVHADEVEGIVALDVALPRNRRQWFERPPPDIEQHLLHALYYGHFFCHVFHRDYIVAKGNDVRQIEQRLRQRLDEIGAEYPAEHNVGHHYEAKPALAAFYRALDPRNQLNPGIGRTSRDANWK